MEQSAALIRILCVENQPVFREGIDAIIGPQVDMSLVAHAMTVAEALPVYRQYHPDVTLMDLLLPDGSGIEALKAIRREFLHARVIMLANSKSESDIQQALDAGARAYLLKSTTRLELLDVIRAVHEGQRYVAVEVASRLAEYIGDERLTDRELQILRLIQNGTRNKQIAELLLIAESTVNFHIKNIVMKLRAKDRTHAVVIALRRGLLDI